MADTPKNSDELNEGLQRAAVLMCDLTVTTVENIDPDTGDVRHVAGLLYITHKDFIVPLGCVMSVQMMQHIIDGMQSLLPVVDFDMEVISVAEDNDNDSIH